MMQQVCVNYARMGCFLFVVESYAVVYLSYALNIYIRVLLHVTIIQCSLYFVLEGYGTPYSVNIHYQFIGVCTGRASRGFARPIISSYNCNNYYCKNNGCD